MEWITQTAQQMREVLAQQRWLEAWQPTIAATPDWALVAAGPTTLVLLWLLLRLFGGRATKPRTERRQSDSEGPPLAGAAGSPRQDDRPVANLATSTSDAPPPEQASDTAQMVDASAEIGAAEASGRDQQISSAEQDAAPVAPPTSKPEGSVDALEFAIGETESSLAVQRLIAALGPISDKSVFDDSYYLNFKAKGVSLRFATSTELSTAFLYAGGKDGYAQYRGRLPHDFEFTDTRRTVEARLGAPRASGGGAINCWLSYEGFGVTFKSKSEADLDTQIAHVSVSERGLFLDANLVAQSLAPSPEAATSGEPDADARDADEADRDFEAILQEIRVACETDPERGLALIDTYTSRVGEQLFLRFCRVLALRRLLVGSEAQARRYGKTLDEAARDLTAGQLQHGERALREIAEIEREDQDYFMDADVKENILDAVCHLMERARPGIVQQILGWTKLDYFGSGRVTQFDWSRLSGADARSNYERMERVSARQKERQFNTRFKADSIVRSAAAWRPETYAITGSPGVEFMLFERLPSPSHHAIGDRIRIGSVLIAEDGNWRFTPAGDGPSTYGGPQVKSEQGRWWYTPKV